LGSHESPDYGRQAARLRSPSRMCLSAVRAGQAITARRLRVPGGSAASDLAGALLAQRAQENGGPGAVGPPRLRDFGEGVARAVPLGDLGVEPAFVAGQ